MTLDDWQQSDPHVKWMRKQMSEPKFRDMLAVLQNMRPAQQPEHLIELGMRQGFDKMFAVILALANFRPRDHEPVPADYSSSALDAIE